MFIRKISFFIYPFAIFLLAFSIRFFYINFVDIGGGDVDFYRSVASNINAGLGFSFCENEKCRPIVGLYFPGYFYFLAFLNILHSDPKFPLFIIAFLTSLSLTYLYFSLKSFLINSDAQIFLIVLVMSISPLSIGFSRLHLIEPVLYIFSLIILSFALRYSKSIKYFIYSVLVFTLAIYFKPTFILFGSVLILFAFFSYGFYRGSRYLILSGIFCLIVILPWELRNINLSNSSLLSASSNIHVIDKGLQKWVNTWAISEYQRADVVFKDKYISYPRLNFSSSYFLSTTDIDNANKIIKSHHHDSSWTKLVDDKFYTLANEKLANYSLIDFSLLRTSQFITSLFHPGQSWGFPVSLDNSLPYLSLSNISKLTVKFFIWIYKTTLFLFFGYIFFKLFSSVTHSLSGYKILVASAFVLLFSTLFLFFFVFYFLEHRYLLPIIPFLELASLLFVFKFKATLYQ